VDVAGEVKECESSDEEYRVEEGEEAEGVRVGLEDGKNRDEVDMRWYSRVD
jgi:hypothetical protein